MWRERGPHPSAPRVAPLRRARVRRQEREPRRAPRRGDPGPAGIRDRGGGVPLVRSRIRPRRDDRRRARACQPGRRRLALGRLQGDRRGDALRAAARVAPGRDRGTLRGPRPRNRPGGAARRRSVERARRGLGRRLVRGPAGELPLGARRRARLRRGARLLGEPLLAAGDQLPGHACGRTGNRHGCDRPADGRRRGLRRALHLQPGERRSEHGGRERELGARARRGRRRRDAGRLPGQQGDGRGGSAGP